MEILKWLNKHPIIRYWDPVYLIMIIITYFSLRPLPSIPFVEGGINFNLLHFLAYMVLSFLVGIAFRHSTNKILKNNHYYFAIFFCFLFGVLIEFLQGFVERTPSLLDVGYNTIGIIFGQMIRYLLRKVRFLNKFF